MSGLDLERLVLSGGPLGYARYSMPPLIVTLIGSCRVLQTNASRWVLLRGRCRTRDGSFRSLTPPVQRSITPSNMSTTENNLAFLWERSNSCKVRGVTIRSSRSSQRLDND